MMIFVNIYHFPRNIFDVSNRQTRNKEQEEEEEQKKYAHYRPFRSTGYSTFLPGHPTADQLLPRCHVTEPWLSALYHTYVPGPCLENLAAERSYLHNSLQQENIKATELLRRISTLEASMSLDGAPNLQRKIRKQLGWLKYRLEETNRQEMAILARLGQITYEIQAIERWSQVEQERMYQQQPFEYPLPNFQNLQPVGMNATSEFQQQEFPFPPQWSYGDWPQQPHEEYPQPLSHWNPHESPPEHLPVNNEKDESISPKDMVHSDGSTVIVKPNERPHLTHRSSSMNNADLDALSTSPSPRSPKPTIKRHSIPTIPGVSKIWALTKEEMGAD